MVRGRDETDDAAREVVALVAGDSFKVHADGGDDVSNKLDSKTQLLCAACLLLLLLVSTLLLLLLQHSLSFGYESGAPK